MCGICGVYGFEDRALIKRMCRSLQHRGPEGMGFHVDENLMLGHARLAIIDLRTGDQPIYNEDRSICVIDNGEIYNFQELRKELEKKGHRFYTQSDTEVIVHCYEEYGLKAFSKFNGIFAIALWDANKKELILARDRNGVKPLHYTSVNDNEFLFASEVKAILQHTDVPKKLNLEAFHFFVNLRYIPRELTMFEGIHRLLPGQYAVINKKGLKTGFFSKYKFVLQRKSEDFFVKSLRKHLKQAVKLQMVSDVPIGIYLSGGLDSSAIVAFASEQSDETVRTFCMGFGEDTDEIEDANFVADHFKTDHRNLIVKTDLLKEYPKMIWYADAPKRNLYPYYLSELVRQKVKVALGGLGGDELFGGYIWKYQYAEDVAKKRKMIPASVRKKLSSSAQNLITFQSTRGHLSDDKNLEYLKKIRHIDSNVDLYLNIQSMDEVFPRAYLENLYGSKMLKAKVREIRDPFKPYFKGKNQLMKQFMEADFQVKMVDDFLFVEDAMSMAHSLESRVPFLENKLVDFAFTIPPSLKWKDGAGKYIFRKAIRPYLPKEVFHKRKQGFGSNVFRTYVNEVHEVAKQRLPEGNIVREKLMSKDYINRVVNHEPSPALTKHYCLALSLFTFEIWYDIYMKNENLRKPRLDASRYF
ncbi:MAG: asparagine synthase (glutamine-hydrolyzing) [Thermoplasmata archaeon]|nr:asparagine synthase (glutamine-hydrolyzing) [Thermoplasmata archaeon]